MIDVITLSDRVKKNTGLECVALIAAHTRTGRNIQRYADIVNKNHRQRQITHTIEKAMMNTEINTQDLISKLMSFDRDEQSESQILHASEKAAMYDMINPKPAMLTGFQKFDQWSGGYHETDLYVIGARPKMGKTAFLLNLITNTDQPSLFVSAEQNSKQCGLRMFSIDAGIHSSKLRVGKSTPDDHNKICQMLERHSAKNTWIFDKPAPSILDIQREARRLHFEHGIKLIFVDYLQKIKPPKEYESAPKREKIEAVAFGLKALAKELNVCVVSLAQVKRAVEERENKRPSMSDIAESSAIEAEADMIATLYRDAVYNEAADPRSAELLIVANRHGEVGKISLDWTPELMRFQERSW